jgi:hypothetical protein
MNARLNTANTTSQSVFYNLPVGIRRHTDIKSITDILDSGRSELGAYKPSQLKGLEIWKHGY